MAKAAAGIHAHQLENTEQAKSLLHEACERIDGIQRGQTQDMGIDGVLEWLECKILREEAEAMIYGRTSRLEDDPEPGEFLTPLISQRSDRPTCASRLAFDAKKSSVAERTELHQVDNAE